MLPLLFGMAYECVTQGSLRVLPSTIAVVVAILVTFALTKSRPINLNRDKQKGEGDSIVPYSLTKPTKPLILTKKLPCASKGEMALLLGGVAMEALATKLANALGVRQLPRPICMSDLAVPETPVTRSAAEFCRRAAGPDGGFIVQHCMRTYLFGVAVAKQLGTVFDRETFFVASLLHDLAWSEEYDDNNLDFEVAGAQHAIQFCKKHGMSDHQASVVHEMIALHTSPALLKDMPAEVHLVSQGAGVDVAGFFVEEVHPTTLSTIVKAHPRLDFKNQCCRVMKDQCCRKPHSHMAMSCSMGFLTMVQMGPFDE